MAKDDYALVVGINFYPRLGESLFGPVNDAKAFRDWLADPAGGDVPDGNIQVVLSNTDPARPQPTADDIADAVYRIIGATLEAEEQVVGRRIYLFFAGHGFMVDGAEQCALVTSAARPKDGRNVEISRYLDFFKQTGMFDEIVFIADCCRTQYPEWVPSFTPPVDPWLRDGERTFVRWFGAPIGGKSREVPPGNPDARGLLTRHLVDGLRALAKGGHSVTVGGLTEWMKQNPPRDPATNAPLVWNPVTNRPDFVVVQGSHPSVTVRVKPASLGANEPFTLVDGKGAPLGEARAPDILERTLPPGLYKVSGSGARTLFEVDPSARGVLDVQL